MSISAGATFMVLPWRFGVAEVKFLSYPARFWSLPLPFQSQRGAAGCSVCPGAAPVRLAKPWQQREGERSRVVCV